VLQQNNNNSSENKVNYLNEDLRTVASRQQEREEIARQIEEFLNHGGEITRLQSCFDNPEHYAFKSFEDDTAENNSSMDEQALSWLLEIAAKNNLDRILA